MTQLISKNQFTYADILKAYMECRKHKRNTKTAMNFEKNFIDKLSVLLRQINTRTFKSGRYTCFAVVQPKPREVWAAPFKNRIIHHLIHNEIGKEFEKHYIDQTYSCIKGRGSLKCIRDAFKGCRSITENWTKEAFFIKLDIKNFFVSLDKNILWNILREKVDENSTLGWLVYKSIFDDITINPHYRHKEILAKVPPYKSLKNINRMQKGLPVGNLTSQFYSNVYMNAFDLYCKHVLKLKYYYRYVDDILILVKDSSSANIIVNQINNWLIENRHLELNTNKTIINRIKYGVKFLGVRMFPHYIIPTKCIFNKLDLAIKNFRKDIFNEKRLATLNSYLGMFIPFNSYSIRTKILKDIRLEFIYNNDGRKVYLEKSI